jgi:hypothetical protein
MEITEMKKVGKELPVNKQAYMRFALRKRFSIAVV